MKVSVAALSLAALFMGAQAAPIQERGIFSDINGLDEVLLFDSAAFQDPKNPQNTLINVQSYVFLKQLDLSPITDIMGDALEKLGLDVGDKADQIIDRLKMFATIGLPGKEVKVSVAGCDTKATLSGTSLKDLGLVTNSVSVGKCGAGVAKASVEGDDFTKDMTIFPSGPDGFGVISDIDDTIKISNVLDKIKLVKATLLDKPAPVPGMPELYKSLSTSLNKPSFFYVSGSPYQLYPFLRDFVSTEFPDARGPIFLRNFTITDPTFIFDSFIGDGGSKIDYKMSQITRVRDMYPKKSFLTIGDSTEKDPEVYAEAFKTLGESFVRCIWIHVVDGADNSDERFSKAFQGIPQERIRLFKDADIAGLASIDVAGGKC